MQKDNIISILKEKFISFDKRVYMDRYKDKRSVFLKKNGKTVLFDEMCKLKFPHCLDIDGVMVKKNTEIMDFIDGRADFERSHNKYIKRVTSNKCSLMKMYKIFLEIGECEERANDRVSSLIAKHINDTHVVFANESDACRVQPEKTVAKYGEIHVYWGGNKICLNGFGYGGLPLGAASGIDYMVTVPRMPMQRVAARSIITGGSFGWAFGQFVYVTLPCIINTKEINYAINDWHHETNMLMAKRMMLSLAYCSVFGVCNKILPFVVLKKKCHKTTYRISTKDHSCFVERKVFDYMKRGPTKHPIAKAGIMGITAASVDLLMKQQYSKIVDVAPYGRGQQRIN